MGNGVLTSTFGVIRFTKKLIYLVLNLISFLSLSYKQKKKNKNKKKTWRRDRKGNACARREENSNATRSAHVNADTI